MCECVYGGAGGGGGRVGEGQRSECPTLPEVLMPLARQMQTRTQASSRHRASCHRTVPISSTPFVMSRTTVLQCATVIVSDMSVSCQCQQQTQSQLPPHSPHLVHPPTPHPNTHTHAHGQQLTGSSRHWESGIFHQMC